MKTSSGALNKGCAVLPNMTDSYEPPAGRRPWQADHSDWAAPSQSQDHPAGPGQPAVPQDRHPGPADRDPGQDSSLGRDPNLGEDPALPPEPPSSAAFGPPGWAAQDPYSSHSNGYVPGGGHLERRPANWPAYEPCPPQPALPGQPPYPTHTASFWRQGWADYDPRSGSGYPVWPSHPAYTARNAGLRRLSKLTWRAAEVSAVIAVGFAALFARTPHSTTSHTGAQQSAKPSIHAAASHHTHKRHRPRHHHHHSGAPATGLAPPSAPPAAAPPQAAPPPAPAAAPQPPPPPPPAPPPPPTTTSGGSGGG